tara:strand:+ start:1110 stop:1259 length:150 start_codon:yes stop_codon:yes gene_type:complete
MAQQTKQEPKRNNIDILADLKPIDIALISLTGGLIFVVALQWILINFLK